MQLQGDFFYCSCLLTYGPPLPSTLLPASAHLVRIGDSSSGRLGPEAGAGGLLTAPEDGLAEQGHGDGHGPLCKGTVSVAKSCDPGCVYWAPRSGLLQLLGQSARRRGRRYTTAASTLHRGETVFALKSPGWPPCYKTTKHPILDMRYSVRPSSFSVRFVLPPPPTEI